MRALIVVDVQPTFCEGGELPVSGGKAVAAEIATLVRERAGDYRLIVTTQDWHIDPGAHFAAHPDFVDSWPPHGIVGTPNAELHPLIAAVIVGVPHVTTSRSTRANTRRHTRASTVTTREVDHLPRSLLTVASRRSRCVELRRAIA